MDLDDTGEVYLLDNLAFPHLWRYSLETIRRGLLASVFATVAEVDGRLVGYQFSTGTNDSAHLSRLAVLPEEQGKGIGSALTVDLLERLIKRGIFSLTVNTQSYNNVSQNLYKKIGFEADIYHFPVYELSLGGNYK